MCHQIFLKEYFEIFSIIFSLRSHKACQKHVLYKFSINLLENQSTLTIMHEKLLNNLQVYEIFIYDGHDFEPGFGLLDFSMEKLS